MPCNTLFLFFTCIHLIFVTETSDAQPALVKWVIYRGCSLKVDGSTNVNEFSCRITNYNKPDTLVINKSKSNKDYQLSGTVSLDVQSFDCGNAIMTADLRKTLKVKTFPKLNIRFLTLSKLPSLNSTDASITGLVDIELAGVSKRINVNYTFTNQTNKIITLVGNKKVNFTDFNLIPPRKLGRMIQTSNELNVEFCLILKDINDN